MRLSPFFRFGKKPAQPSVGCPSLDTQVSPGFQSLPASCPPAQPAVTHGSLEKAAEAEINFFDRNWFLPTQSEWVNDNWPLKIWEKSRQFGATKTDAFHSVLVVSPADAKFDVWVSSRDEVQARLYLEDARDWARILNLAAVDLGVVVLDRRNNFSARVLEFANGRRIYCLSSNPNALAGKRGHVKIDEFALHEDQRLLYRIAKPVTQWGGTLSIISTHRGAHSVFNELIREVTERGNPMGWSLHSVPLQRADDHGLLERINSKSRRHE